MVTARFHWAGAAYLFLAAAERLGVPKERILAAAGLSWGDLPVSPGRISWALLEPVTRSALELTGEPALGLLAGLEATIDHHGIAGAYYMHTSPLRESQKVAYDQVYPKVTNILRFWHEERDALALNCMAVIPQEDPLFEVHLHLFLGMHVFGMRAVFGEQTTIDHVALRSTAVGAAERLSSLLGCRVLTGQPQDWVAIPRPMLERRLPLADPWMREQLHPQFEAFLRMLDQDLHTTMAVRTALESALAGGTTADLDAIAGVLRLKPRTLQARLAAEDTSFTAVLDGTRKEFSLRRLSFPGTKLAAVAAQAGFSDAAAFTRAFRRWTGSTPREWQEQRTKPE